ncbi:hypothetical protein GRI39_12605 [Altererythrobacter indicus]|uniref:Tip attachment protein J domain-containing protein n=1 Tax=Altericroceibacterium indicum TaxID=374177 RepID=A0A845ACA1_9SPHN|nr:phage tail protein [Altericroceibacterium indicum]MXP26873.1 hypothetical protein [Altericroceibacterium indicum]
MATLVFTAVGTALGGPLGGALGSLIGSQVDQAVFGSNRQGSRLKELALTTSSYGTAIPRHFGRMRVAGSIIWASDLVESSEATGGSKGAPSTQTYSYSASFAVALSSSPVHDIGRIWADGTLLRGAAGDLKVGGTFRFYRGGGDNTIDPLIASAEGAACPAFRGLSYCVFENLQLADFGNRIPALNFELIGKDGTPLRLASLIGPLPDTIHTLTILPGLSGFSCEGGSLLNLLSTCDALYPLSCNVDGTGLTITSAQNIPPDPPLLPEPAMALDSDSHAPQTGKWHQRKAGSATIPNAIRYYDATRDYQPGVQRADGKAASGRGETLQFPGTLNAQSARDLVNGAAERAGWRSEMMGWRLAELDPTLGPGSIVRVPDQPGYWLIESWEWRDQGIELELRRLPRGPARQAAADGGTVLAPRDRIATPTVLHAFELPWDGIGAATNRNIYAAPSSVSDGWTGAALYTVRDGQLIPLGPSGPRRAIIGKSLTPLGSSSCLRLDPSAQLEIELASADFTLTNATPEMLASGSNRALLGEEVIQFSQAAHLGANHWRLSGLLRGRGGTEARAVDGNPALSPFTLLDHRCIPLDQTEIATQAGTQILALGIADDEPVYASLANAGISLKPLMPVHPRMILQLSGDITFTWSRRARGAWEWRDQVDVPLNEEAESYLLGIGPFASPEQQWSVTLPSITLPADSLSDYSGKPLWVCQQGSFALSAPLLLTILP